jgi:hypothetical protein
MVKAGRTNVHDEERSGPPSVVSDDLHNFDKTFVKTALYNFRIFVCISTISTYSSLRDYHSYARLLQVLSKMDSKNAHGCTQSAENCFGFDFF